MYQQHANPMHGHPAASTPTRRPSLSVAMRKHSRRAGFLTHALSGLGWGLTTPVVWIISIVFIFITVFGAAPSGVSDGSTLGDLQDEIIGNIADAPEFATYIAVVVIACAVLAIASLIVGLVSFRRWGFGRAFGIIAIPACILHIVVFPVAVLVGLLVTQFTMAVTGAGSPFASELPVSLVVLTVIAGVFLALINGLVGMLLTWLFAHAFRPREPLTD